MVDHSSFPPARSAIGSVPHESVRAGGAAGAAGGVGGASSSRSVKLADGVTVAEDAPDDEDPALDEADAAGRRPPVIYAVGRVDAPTKTPARASPA